MTLLVAMLVIVHAVYTALLSTVPEKVLSGIGLLIALALISIPALRRDLDRELPRTASLWSLAPFVLPAILSIFSPTVAFAHLDPRFGLALAWMLMLLWVIRGMGKTSDMPLVTLLFLFWSGVVWLLIVWDAGVGRVVKAATQDDRLLLSFRLWETRPISQHLFLIWLTQSDFDHRIAYTNHLHPYSLMTYAWVKAPQVLVGLAPPIARNLVPFGTAAWMLAGLAIMVRRALPADTPALRFHLTLFVVSGLVVTEPQFWWSHFTTNYDNPFPLFAVVTAFAWAAGDAWLQTPDPRGSALLPSAVVCGLFGWIYAPIIAIALWLCAKREGPSSLRVNGPLTRATAVMIAISMATLTLPLVLVSVKGYGNEASSFLSRSGLDGDTRYFHNVAQAVLRPYYGAPRRLWELAFPAAVPLVLAIVLCGLESKAIRLRLARQVMFLFTPYLVSLALFAQAVSIHPYLYDQLLIVPAALAGAFWSLSPMIQRRLEGPGLLAGLLLALILVMANLIGIAQAMAAWHPR
jgi:hypothetical protein